MWQKTLTIESIPGTLCPITAEIESLLPELPAVGMLNCFLQHTSCGLIIQENADPSARTDLQKFAKILSPDDQPWHQHTHEGPDDTTSHMKSAVFGCSLNIPIVEHKLGLGTWQGIFLWEFRQRAHRRKIVLTIF